MRWYVINTKHNHQVVIRRSDASKQELRRCYLPIHSSNGSLCGQETNKYAVVQQPNGLIFQETLLNPSTAIGPDYSVCTDRNTRAAKRAAQAQRGRDAGPALAMQRKHGV